MTESNRVAMVTGASRGLGLVIARVLAERGCRLVIGARGAEALAEAADTLQARGAQVTAISGDITDPSVRSRLVEAARDSTFRQVLNRAARVTPDGMPLVWFGRLRGARGMRRAYGGCALALGRAPRASLP